MMISEYEMERRRLVNLAGSYLLDALIKFTSEHAELTAWEWVKAWRDAWESKAIAMELLDEWKQP